MTIESVSPAVGLGRSMRTTPGRADVTGHGIRLEDAWQL
jgi:hypothetical protein